MDCKTARMLVELRGNRAAELPAEDSVSLDRHLESCVHCRNILAVEGQLDAPVRKAMTAIPIPPGLKLRLLDRLATERGAWHRRRAWYVAAAAAAVIIGVGIVTWNPDRKPKINLYELVESADQYVESPKVAAETWLASQGIRYQPAEPFNPHLLAFHGLVTIQGKQVPMLCYKSYEDGIPVSAKVYLIRAADFDLTALQKPPDGGSLGGRGQQVKLYPAPDQPDKLVYVIVYNSRSLDPFFNQSPRT